MAVGKVSDADFEAEVLKATGPVVVDFWAEWCGPCRMIAPALDEISGAMGDKVKIVKLNVDESPKTASKYGVMSIPTLDDLQGRRDGLASGRRRTEAEIAAVDHRRGVICFSKYIFEGGRRSAGRFVFSGSTPSPARRRVQADRCAAPMLPSLRDRTAHGGTSRASYPLPIPG